MPRKDMCCVPECKYKPGTVRHNFPVYEEELFKIWVERIANPRFAKLDDIVMYKNFLVCDDHFSVHCKSVGTKRLKKFSLPTQNLPAFDGELSLQTSMYNHLKEAKSHSVCMESPMDCSGIVDENSHVVQQLTPTTAKTGQCSTPVGVESATECSSTLQELQDHNYSARRKIPSNVNKGHNASSGQFSTPVKRCKGLLRQVHVRSAKFLTPKAQHIYGVARKLRRKAQLMSRKCLTFKKRLSAAEKFTCSKTYKNILSDVNSTTRIFIESQVRNQKRKPKGYRFTTSEKVLSLSLFKQSGRGYRLMSKMFALPSRKTMTIMLKKVPFQPGLNHHILKHLEETVQKLQPLDKYCTLVFDEMSLSPGLYYHATDDKVIGFEDVGDVERKPKLADHAIVFMVRGVHKKWKQPIAYMLIQGTTKTVDLVRFIKAIVRGLFQARLKVLATVCDQGSTNVSAINYLVNETKMSYCRQNKEYRHIFFEVDGKEILPLFDPPHLLKGMRNNLLEKDMIFIENGKVKTASWKHVIQFYELDNLEGDEDKKMCPRLTDEHVYPAKMKKMKVKCCSQVFSQRVSSIMRRLAQCSRQLDAQVQQGSTVGEGLLDPAAEDTADFLLFMDRLFDSVNGSCPVPLAGKNLRCAATTTSPHNEFWAKALKMLSSMTFYCCKTQRKSVPPSLKHWIWTISGLRHLSDRLLNGGFRFLALRNFNQDPLENFFCSVRSHGVRNVNPTSTGFVSAFKSLIVSNLMSSHSLNSNCEEDDTEGALDTLKSFLQADEIPVEQPQEEARHVVPPRKEVISQSRIATATSTYISGFVAKKVFSLTKNCSVCKDVLMTHTEMPQHEFIIARRYSPKALCLPHTTFASICHQIISMIQNKLPEVCYMPGVAKILCDSAYKIDLSFLCCSKHDVKSLAVKAVVKLMIYAWITNVNRILKGKMTVPPSCSDPIKMQAQRLHCRNRGKMKNK